MKVYLWKLNLISLLDDNKLAELDCIKYIEYFDHYFTFIDLIIEIVPEHFYNFIFTIFNNNNTSLRIISIFLHYIFIEFHKEVWKPRCDLAIKEDQLRELTNAKRNNI